MQPFRQGNNHDEEVVVEEVVLEEEDEAEGEDIDEEEVSLASSSFKSLLSDSAQDPATPNAQEDVVEEEHGGLVRQSAQDPSSTTEEVEGGVVHSPHDQRNQGNIYFMQGDEEDSLQSQRNNSMEIDNHATASDAAPTDAERERKRLDGHCFPFVNCALRPSARPMGAEEILKHIELSFDMDSIYAIAKNLEHAAEGFVNPATTFTIQQMLSAESAFPSSRFNVCLGRLTEQGLVTSGEERKIPLNHFPNTRIAEANVPGIDKRFHIHLVLTNRYHRGGTQSSYKARLTHKELHFLKAILNTARSARMQDHYTVGLERASLKSPNKKGSQTSSSLPSDVTRNFMSSILSSLRMVSQGHFRFGGTDLKTLMMEGAPEVPEGEVFNYDEAQEFAKHMLKRSFVVINVAGVKASFAADKYMTFSNLNLPELQEELHLDEANHQETEEGGMQVEHPALSTPNREQTVGQTGSRPRNMGEGEDANTNLDGGTHRPQMHITPSGDSGAHPEDGSTFEQPHESAPSLLMAEQQHSNLLLEEETSSLTSSEEDEEEGEDEEWLAEGGTNNQSFIQNLRSSNDFWKEKEFFPWQERREKLMKTWHNPNLDNTGIYTEEARTDFPQTVAENFYIPTSEEQAKAKYAPPQFSSTYQTGEARAKLLRALQNIGKRVEKHIREKLISEILNLGAAHEVFFEVGINIRDKRGKGSSTGATREDDNSSSEEVEVAGDVACEGHILLVDTFNAAEHITDPTGFHPQERRQFRHQGNSDRNASFIAQTNGDGNQQHSSADPNQNERTPQSRPTGPALVTVDRHHASNLSSTPSNVTVQQEPSLNEVRTVSELQQTHRQATVTPQTGRGMQRPSSQQQVVQPSQEPTTDPSLDDQMIDMSVEAHDDNVGIPQQKLRAQVYHQFNTTCLGGVHTSKITLYLYETEEEESDDENTGPGGSSDLSPLSVAFPQNQCFFGGQVYVPHTRDLANKRAVVAEQAKYQRFSSTMQDWLMTGSEEAATSVRETFSSLKLFITNATRDLTQSTHCVSTTARVEWFMCTTGAERDASFSLPIWKIFQGNNHDFLLVGKRAAWDNYLSQVMLEPTRIINTLLETVDRHSNPSAVLNRLSEDAKTTALVSSEFVAKLTEVPNVEGPVYRFFKKECMGRKDPFVYAHGSCIVRLSEVDKIALGVDVGLSHQLLPMSGPPLMHPSCSSPLEVDNDQLENIFTLPAFPSEKGIQEQRRNRGVQEPYAHTKANKMMLPRAFQQYKFQVLTLLFYFAGVYGGKATDPEQMSPLENREYEALQKPHGIFTPIPYALIARAQINEPEKAKDVLIKVFAQLFCMWHTEMHFRHLKRARTKVFKGQQREAKSNLLWNIEDFPCTKDSLDTFVQTMRNKVPAELAAAYSKPAILAGNIKNRGNFISPALYVHTLVVFFYPLTHFV